MAGNESVVVSTVGNSRSVCVQLHPLVIMNISDHYTRIRAQAGGGNPQVFGALLGTQEGRSMEILNSFELQFDVIDSDVIINTDYYHTKAEQCKEGQFGHSKFGFSFSSASCVVKKRPA